MKNSSFLFLTFFATNLLCSDLDQKLARLAETSVSFGKQDQVRADLKSCMPEGLEYFEEKEGDNIAARLASSKKYGLGVANVITQATLDHSQMLNEVSRGSSRTFEILVDSEVPQIAECLIEKAQAAAAASSSDQVAVVQEQGGIEEESGFIEKLNGTSLDTRVAGTFLVACRAQSQSNDDCQEARFDDSAMTISRENNQDGSSTLHTHMTLNPQDGRPNASLEAQLLSIGQLARSRGLENGGLMQLDGNTECSFNTLSDGSVDVGCATRVTNDELSSMRQRLDSSVAARKALFDNPPQTTDEKASTFIRGLHNAMSFGGDGF